MRGYVARFIFKLIKDSLEIATIADPISEKRDFNWQFNWKFDWLKISSEYVSKIEIKLNGKYLKRNISVKTKFII